MKTNRSRFQRGSGVYTCRRCKKQTRDTQTGEAQHQLCANCYEIESYENQHNDDGHDGELVDCEDCKSQMNNNARKALEAEKKCGHEWSLLTIDGMKCIKCGHVEPHK